MMFRKVLALSPHTDDVELACGATLAKMVESGSHVQVICFARIRDELEAECSKAMKILGIKNVTFYDLITRRFPQQRQEILQILFDYNAEKHPDLVLCPATTDVHQDHQQIMNETKRAFKQSSIFGYFDYWNHVELREDGIIPFEERFLNKKLECLKAYKSQEHRHYFDPDYIRSCARSRGGAINRKYAEAFEIIRLVLMEI